MAGVIKTVKVINTEAKEGFIIINESDFNPKEHHLLDSKPPQEEVLIPQPLSQPLLEEFKDESSVNLITPEIIPEITPEPAPTSKKKKEI